MTERDAVIFANEVFYRAFADRDMTAMAAIWSSNADVSCIHPGWNALSGRRAVLSSWQAIFEGPSPPRIECRAAKATVIGETAIVVCYEKIANDALVATNIFVREDDGWHLVHHQAGPASELPPEASQERRTIN